LHRKVTFEMRDVIVRLRSEEKTLREIGIVVGLNATTVGILLNTNFKSMGRYSCKNCGHPTNSEWKICRSNPHCKSEYAKHYYKDRRRNDYLKHAYGITEQEFDELYEAQNGCCAICVKKITKRQARVDHDHKTNCNRKVLCHNCNVGLGHFFDDPELLISAAAYIIAHQAEVIA
jgi:peptide methionine sulfoxide reductase MsrB